MEENMSDPHVHNFIYMHVGGMNSEIQSLAYVTQRNKLTNTQIYDTESLIIIIIMIIIPKCIPCLLSVAHILVVTSHYYKFHSH